MKIGSICSGYGGLDMAAEYVFQAETIWMADSDKYSSIVIDKRWGLPNLGNIKNVDWSLVEPIDILTAGYPCQPFSQAGQRKGVNDERHIWPKIKEIISILRPRFVVLENVRGHLSLGFKEVLKDIAQIGYDAKWEIIRASDVGAPHRRERLFVIAQPTNTNCERSDLGKCKTEEWNQRKSQFESCKCNSIIANANGNKQSGNWKMSRLGRRYDSRAEMRLQTTPNPLDINNKLNAEFVEYMMGLPKGWVTDLPISRSQQLKLLGNGVVPQQAELAIKTLLEMPSDLAFYD